VSSFYFVYILQSESRPDRFYTGFTEDLDARLQAHNGGRCDHTRPFRPWRIKTAVMFTDPDKARAFEHYLKSASGRAFAKKRL
jgi:predicted GIY-YIG superfamily endonuclease